MSISRLWGETMHDELAARNRELEIIYSIDRLRDSTPHETEFIGGLISILVNSFQLDFCSISLKGGDTQESGVRTLIDRRGIAPAFLDRLQTLAESSQALELLELAELPAWHVLNAPLAIAGERLGTIVLGRSAHFTTEDVNLMDAALSQIDSAIVHSRTLRQLKQRNRELELIYTVDRIRDQESDMDRMLQRVLTTLCSALSAEACFVALFDDQNEAQLEIKLTGDEGVITSQHYEAAQRLSAHAIQTHAPFNDNSLQGTITSATVVPLLLNERIIGVVGALNSRQSSGFNAGERALLTAVTSQIDTAVFERKEQRRLRSLLARAVDPKVLDHLLRRATTQILTGERVFLSVLFADIRGSTAWAANTDADSLVRILNLFYERMTAVIFRYGGTLDKYVGDQVIALFGTPVPMEDHALQAVRAAVEMRAAYQQLQAEMASDGFILPPLGIGVNSGEATAGEFGARQRSDFTAIGPAVNLCARLCSAASGGEILISDSTHRLLGGRLASEAARLLTLKGFVQPIQSYRLPN